MAPTPAKQSDAAKPSEKTPSARPARKKSAEKTGKRIRIVQYVSGIGYDFRQRRVLAGLGLSRPGRSVELEDTPSVRGMVAKIPHLVRIEESGS